MPGHERQVRLIGGPKDGDLVSYAVYQGTMPAVLVFQGRFGGDPDFQICTYAKVNDYTYRLAGRRYSTTTRTEVIR